MTYYKVTSNDYPQLVDITSSPTTVYLRKNIKAVDVEDEMAGNTRTEYHYDEAAISKDEYINMLHEQQEVTDEALQELILSLEV